MPANDFENKAKQLLDELSIRPKEELWLQVEKRIREKRRRRWFLIIPLMAVIMLGGYFVVQQYGGGDKNNFNTTNQNLNNTHTPGNEKINDKTTGTTKLSEAETKDENKKSVKADVNAGKENSVSLKADKKNAADINADVNVVKSKPVTDKKKINLPGDDKTTKDAAVKKQFEKKPVLQPAVTRVNDDDAVKTKTAEPVKDKSVDAAAAAEPVKSNDAAQTDNEPAAKQPDESKPAAEENKVEEKKPEQTSTAPIIHDAASPAEANTEKKKATAKSKWKPGIMFSAGISNTNDNIFNLGDGQKALDNQGSVNVPGGTIRYFASPYNQAFALQAGVFVQKNISKKGSISIGLNYALYQSKITVGSAVDPNILGPNIRELANVYRGNSSSAKSDAYNNRLHYIEVPVNYSLQLNRSKTFPVYWDAGISIGYLTGTNYLHFDSALNGIYFEDKNLINKFNFNLQTGFSFSLLNKTNTPVKAGPLLQAALTDILKSPAEKRFIYYGGVRMQMLLGGKKKK